MLQHQDTQISACSGNASKEAKRIATVTNRIITSKHSKHWKQKSSNNKRKKETGIKETDETC